MSEYPITHTHTSTLSPLGSRVEGSQRPNLVHVFSPSTKLATQIWRSDRPHTVEFKNVLVFVSPAFVSPRWPQEPKISRRPNLIQLFSLAIQTCQADPAKIVTSLTPLNSNTSRSSPAPQFSSPPRWPKVPKVSQRTNLVHPFSSRIKTRHADLAKNVTPLNRNMSTEFHAQISSPQL